MFGKHFSQMYTGSMVGAGFGAYALMGYVIANQKPDRKVGFYVELTPKLLAAVFGEPEEEIQKAIDYLCAPDANSRSPEEEGRRLVKIGAFAYRVVNGLHYHKIRCEEDRREQNRLAQEKARLKRKGKPLPGEERFVEMEKNGEDTSMEPGNKIPLPPACQ